MAAERRHLVGEHAGQPVRPVLRIHHDARDAREFRWKYARLPEQLRAEVEPDRQPRRPRFGEGRTRSVVVGGQLLRPVMLIVEHRQRQIAAGVEQRGSHAMCRHRNRVDMALAIERAEAVEDEVPQTIDVEMRIGTVTQHRVRRAPRVDLGKPVEVDQRHLGVGLADVDDGDVADRCCCHSIWNTVSSGTATGSLSGFVSMMSAI